RAVVGEVVGAVGVLVFVLAGVGVIVGVALSVKEVEVGIVSAHYRVRIVRAGVMLVVRAVLIGVECLPGRDICGRQRRAEVSDRSGLRLDLGVAYVLKKDDSWEPESRVFWQQLFEILPWEVESGAGVVDQELEEHGDSGYGGDAGRTAKRLNGAGDAVDVLGPVVDRVEDAVAVLVCGECLGAESLGSRLVGFQLEGFESDGRRLVRRGIDDVEVEGGGWVAGPVDKVEG